jgi:hypothetical protein
MRITGAAIFECVVTKLTCGRPTTLSRDRSRVNAVLMGDLSKGVFFCTAAALSRDRSRPDAVFVGELR